MQCCGVLYIVALRAVQALLCSVVFCNVEGSTCSFFSCIL